MRGWQCRGEKDKVERGWQYGGEREMLECDRLSILNSI